MSRLEYAIDRICQARSYTENLLNSTDPKDWFRQPSEGVTHVAWQVGHLAFAEYHLTLQRRRGRQADDVGLISDQFLSLFRKDSVPDPDPAKYPTAEEIRQVFDRVHVQAVEELRGLADVGLDEPSEPPHPMFKTKFGALHYCSMQEMLHAGQIGLLRRLLGMKPVR